MLFFVLIVTDYIATKHNYVNYYACTVNLLYKVIPMFAAIRMHVSRKPKNTMRCNWELVGHGQQRQGRRDIIHLFIHG